jgi:hypothetical protein
LLIVGLYATWMLLPLLVLGSGYANGGGTDGPCLGATAWTARAPEGSAVHSETRWLPPGERCVIDGAGGYHAERVFPGNGTWMAVLALVLAPIALWPLMRRMATEAQINRPGIG